MKKISTWVVYEVFAVFGFTVSLAVVEYVLRIGILFCAFVPAVIGFIQYLRNLVRSDKSEVNKILDSGCHPNNNVCKDRNNCTWPKCLHQNIL